MKRYDQRDAMCYRGPLSSGMIEYETYYSMHPELKETDDKVRQYHNDQLSHDRRLKRYPNEKVAEALSRGTLESLSVLLDAVDGPVSEEVVEVERSDISWRIKGFAKYLGAGLVGITHLNQSWVYSHTGHLRFGGWGSPIHLPHKYAIVMVFPQNWDMWLTLGKPGIPGALDSLHTYNIMRAAAVRLAAAIRDLGYPARAQIQGNYNCLLPPLAVEAGLGEQCRIGICLTKEYGLAFRLCAVTTDLPLAPDPPINLGIEDFCNKCYKCAENCPVKAISFGPKAEVDGIRAWKHDAYKCFEYWNYLGVGCSICRRVCPWTKPRRLLHRSVANLAIHIPTIRRLLVVADNIIYGKVSKYYPPPKWLRNDNHEIQTSTIS
jgi:ferredoxin